MRRLAALLGFAAFVAMCKTPVREEPEAAAPATVTEEATVEPLDDAGEEPGEEEEDAAPAVAPADASFGADAGTDAGRDAGKDASLVRRADVSWKYDASALGAEDAAADPHCPKGMIFVAGTFCPKVERHCLKSEVGSSYLTICQEFEEGVTECTEPEEERAFCIDKYEYPNERGAHPTWMVTWYDAQATCLAKGKRLCYASEWTMACEGPDRTPFPYGWKRDKQACNIDNPFIEPSLAALFPPDAGYDAAMPELERLDQSVPSGAMPRCVSGFGVRDQPGNFDEWVINDETAAGDEVGKWAALKGGAWGHVRNACRPVTTKHSPGWSYYFTAFRCCSDAADSPAYVPKNAPFPPPKVQPQDRAPKVTRPDAGKVAAPSPHPVPRPPLPAPSASR